MINLQHRREREGLSRSALARLADMNAATISQIESGYIGKPYQSQLDKLARALKWEGEPTDLLAEANTDED